MSMWLDLVLTIDNIDIDSVAADMAVLVGERAAATELPNTSVCSEERDNSGSCSLKKIQGAFVALCVVG